jgi:hypothetical protein
MLLHAHAKTSFNKKHPEKVLKGAFERLHVVHGNIFSVYPVKA